ncbi:MAG TPA: hypothetical protein VK464_11450 [Symbiobacteriaceae bacterium]|jgi:hypothetical protein|nr:hypothetical protein [Symbiobacteriaceae bacterium]
MIRCRRSVSWAIHGQKPTQELIARAANAGVDVQGDAYVPAAYRAHLTRGMAAALPYLDLFLPCHHMCSLEQLTHHLKG